ncbi:MAG: glutamine hydrolyzing CTP synthase [Nanoarchaeota archaeon]
MGEKRDIKYIVITGGVLSGLGKGVVSASIGRLFSSRYKVMSIKCDGYLNVDPGTMNPTIHGEVFVLDDGGEVDLDFGHYERFMNIDCRSEWSITSGKVFLTIMEKERRGEFLGGDVQVVPHVTGEIRERIKRLAQEASADIALIEIGGTVGDMENLWFMEAARELLNDVGRDHVLFVHLGLLPVIDSQGQQKTKPLQQSVNLLRERGIFPDVIIGRTKERLTDSSRRKLGLRCNVGEDAVISDPDCDYVYELPLIFEEEGLDAIISKKFGLEKEKGTMDAWRTLIDGMKHPKQEITVAICGKYTDLADSYISILEALSHAGAYAQTRVSVRWLETTDIRTEEDAGALLEDVDAMIVPGGFGSRGIEGKITAIRYARTHKIPFLGICYGLQLAVIEHARHVMGIEQAHTTEIDSETTAPVVDILPEQVEITDKGGTMRLGAYPAILSEGTMLAGLYGATHVSERHRHRFEVNPEYHDELEGKGLLFAGKSPDGKLVEFIERDDHPFFVATQGHPELKSRFDRPAPMFAGLVRAALKKKELVVPDVHA